MPASLIGLRHVVAAAGFRLCVWRAEVAQVRRIQWEARAAQVRRWGEGA